MRVRFLSAVLGAAVTIVAGATARADVRTYTVDPTASTLQFSGTIAGLPAGPQTAGSDTTRYSGSLMADVTSTTIQFLDGGAIDAQQQALSQQPSANGTSFTAAAADYGFTFNQPPFDTGRAAIRNLILDMTSGVLARSGTSIPSGQNVVVDSGVIDYRVEGLNNANGREPQTGEFAINEAGPGTLTVVGNIETLTIPISARYFFTTIDISDARLTATGQIVATRVIPEPTSAGVLTIAAAVACGLRRRRQSP
jgi:hypothetical protein